MPLTAHPTPAYPIPVTATSVTGRENPMAQAQQRPLAILAHFLRPQSLYDGRRWATARLAGPCARFLTPTSSASIVVRSDLADSKFLHRSLCYV